MQRAKGKQQPIVPARVSKNSLKPKKEKTAWTVDSAKGYIANVTRKNAVKGLKYWAAVDFLKRSGVLVDIYE